MWVVAQLALLGQVLVSLENRSSLFDALQHATRQTIMYGYVCDAPRRS